jgi:phage terminase small subunit
MAAKRPKPAAKRAAPMKRVRELIAQDPDIQAAKAEVPRGTTQQKSAKPAKPRKDAAQARAPESKDVALIEPPAPEVGTLAPDELAALEVIDGKLNNRQRAFVRWYAATENASESARRAGYSLATAGQIGHALLKKFEVSEAIRLNQLNKLRVADITHERILQEVARLAFFDASQLFDEHGNPLPITALDEDTARAIQGVKVVTKGNADMGYADITEFKAADKKSSLELLMRHAGMLKDKLELDANLKHDVADELRTYLAGTTSKLPVKE